MKPLQEAVIKIKEVERHLLGIRKLLGEAAFPEEDSQQICKLFREGELCRLVHGGVSGTTINPERCGKEACVSNYKGEKIMHTEMGNCYTCPESMSKQCELGFGSDGVPPCANNPIKAELL